MKVGTGTVIDAFGKNEPVKSVLGGVCGDGLAGDRASGGGPGNGAVGCLDDYRDGGMM